ncbi:MAG: insulinase family protein, partial [Muribaculaceae bacterium]|nr:insulinase family protein [Muribaculaceae bacterium]
MKKKRTNFIRPFVSALLLGGMMLPTYAEVTDTHLKEGTLPNGLTYYIYRNAEPSGRVDFFLSRNIGSRVEEADEKGLAHFLEHMCFNGSRNFPDNRLIEWLESVGVKFGKNLNAYTSADETVYNISMVPSGRESVLDSCLMVLRDWSDGLTLADAAIDSERGVIKGEWRHRDNAASRMLRRAAPRLYPGSPYGEAMPIGTMEVVENFPPQKLRDFYRKWYTPGAEAVIVAGDVDPEEMERKIAALFSDMGKDSKAVLAQEPEFPVNDRLSVIVESDPEQSTNMIQLYFKHDDRGLSSEERLRRELLADLISSMLIERFDALELADNTPVANVGVGDTNFLLSKKVKAYIVRAQAKPGRTDEALKALYRELRRGREKGFSNEDFENARAELLEKERNKAVERKSRSNTDLAKEISRYFTEGGVFETPAERLTRGEKMLEGITAEDCRARLAELVDPSGRNAVVLTYLRPGKGGELPSEKELEEAFY